MAGVGAAPQRGETDAGRAWAGGLRLLSHKAVAPGLERRKLRGPTARPRASWCGVAMLLAAAGCSGEKRMLDPDLPLTAPAGAQDPRASQFVGNAYQVSQGGRYFAWYGCGTCHGAGATGARDLGDGQWRHGGSVDRIYHSIAGHGALGARVPPEQLWQLAAYVRQLPGLDPPRRRRQDNDQIGEAQAGSWPGPVQ